MTVNKKHSPVRTCISCGEKRVKKDLLRLVTNGKGVVNPDESGSMPGRGAYVCEREECRARASSNRLLGRVFRMPGPFKCGFPVSSD